MSDNTVECCGPEGPPCASCQASDADRAWFAAHPGAEGYTRPPLPGELLTLLVRPGDDDGQWMIAVALLAPGLRTRMPVRCEAVDKGGAN